MHKVVSAFVPIRQLECLFICAFVYLNLLRPGISHIFPIYPLLLCLGLYRLRSLFFRIRCLPYPLVRVSSDLHLLVHGVQLWFSCVAFASSWAFTPSSSRYHAYLVLSRLDMVMCHTFFASRTHSNILYMHSRSFLFLSFSYSHRK